MTPHSQPRTSARRAVWACTTTQIRGATLNHARNHRSKFGKERTVIKLDPAPRDHSFSVGNARTSQDQIAVPPVVRPPITCSMGASVTAFRTASLGWLSQVSESIQKKTAGPENFF